MSNVVTTGSPGPCDVCGGSTCAHATFVDWPGDLFARPGREVPRVADQPKEPPKPEPRPRGRRRPGKQGPQQDRARRPGPNRGKDDER